MLAHLGYPYNMPSDQLSETMVDWLRVRFFFPGQGEPVWISVGYKVPGITGDESQVRIFFSGQGSYVWLPTGLIRVSVHRVKNDLGHGRTRGQECCAHWKTTLPTVP